MASLLIFEVEDTSSAFDLPIADPSNAGIGAEIIVRDKSDGSNPVTITPSAGTIDGEANATVPAGGSMRLLCDGEKWMDVGGVTPPSGQVFGGWAEVTTDGSGNPQNYFGRLLTPARKDNGDSFGSTGGGRGGIPFPAGTLKNLRVFNSGLSLGEGATHTLDVTVLVSTDSTALTLQMSASGSASMSTPVEIVAGSIVQIFFDLNIEDAETTPISIELAASFEFVPA